MMRKALLILLCLGFFVSCMQQNQSRVVHIQLIDRNGSMQSINHTDKIRKIDQTDFLAPQPYQKITRVFGKDREGKTKSVITTYHDNGQVFQYLETMNGRAHGLYKEWHDNGILRMVAHVVEGVGDLTRSAQTTWVFDQKSEVWDEEGHIVAEFIYDKGLLSGKALYYHKNGTIAKEIPYDRDLIKGAVQFYNENGSLIGQTQFKNGKKDGPSYFLGTTGLPKREEKYQEGKLISGVYWNFEGSIMREIVQGNGFKPIFENGRLKKECEYKDGNPEGEVLLYRDSGRLETKHYIVNAQKDGEEWFYYDVENPHEHPKLQISWKKDEITGMVRTWYSNGSMQSEKEMAENQKNGLSVAWYEDGSLMFVEEYRKDQLVNGRYYPKGSETPVSKVIDGEGVATIYNAKGTFERKVQYHKYEPIE